MEGPFRLAPMAERIRILPHTERNRPKCRVDWQDARGVWHTVPKVWTGYLPVFLELWEEIRQQSEQL